MKCWSLLKLGRFPCVTYLTHSLKVSSLTTLHRCWLLLILARVWCLYISVAFYEWLHVYCIWLYIIVCIGYVPYCNYIYAYYTVYGLSLVTKGDMAWHGAVIPPKETRPDVVRWLWPKETRPDVVRSWRQHIWYYTHIYIFIYVCALFIVNTLITFFVLTGWLIR